MFQKILDEGQAGDNVGCLLRGVEKKDISVARCSGGTEDIKPHTKFEAEVYVLTKEEGGRHSPFFSGYKPAVLLPHHGRDRQDQLVGGARCVCPATTSKIEVDLGRQADRDGRRPSVRGS